MERTLLGAAALLLAIAFNLPFALLAQSFDYPDILRRPAGEVLDAFAAGGSSLIFSWYAFALSSVGLIFFAPALALTTADWARRPGLAVAAALIGAFAGLTQAIGLMRWVFAVPALALAHASPETDAATRSSLETAFTLLNGWGGVAIGEHLGQILTLAWITLAALQALSNHQHFARPAAILALLAVAGIAIGLGEGLSIARGHDAPLLAMATVAGYLAFSLWLLATGAGLVAHSFFPARQTL
jgi:Domain of unknown function (DUF4386)